jgi:ferredoxin
MSAGPAGAALLVVDAGRCRGHRQCVFVAPGLLAIGVDGIPRQRPGADVASDPQAAQDAVLFCPENAVSLRAGAAPGANPAEPALAAGGGAGHDDDA